LWTRSQAAKPVDRPWIEASGSISTGRERLGESAATGFVTTDKDGKPVATGEDGVRLGVAVLEAHDLSPAVSGPLTELTPGGSSSKRAPEPAKHKIAWR
jgi:hypothetical protein